MASPMSQVAKTRYFLVMILVGDRAERILFNLPASGFSHEMFLPQAEHYTGAYCEDGFLHRENILLHVLHVELVLSLVEGKELAPWLHIGYFRDALHDDRFICMFGTHYAVGVLGQVTRLA